ncbi:Serine/threonine-protein kinase GRIK2 [Vitis vinifera]|uniref:Serine/threonine-protein kinase GRIK2 n=1 Tax=Vitis vinifera TaxID=29760 RepID=A0A438DTL9_VITVI|nr:Serine/threonine-protein kinase GRIK2 [Vitis vinifera]
MFSKDYSIARVTEMGCCGCFGFVRKPESLSRPGSGSTNCLSQEFLLEEDIEEVDDRSYNGEVSDTAHGDDGELQSRVQRSEEILMLRTQNGMICREFPVKETHKLIRSEDENGNKTINEYVREYKIGSGSYGKVVLYRSLKDGNHYAIKVLPFPHLILWNVFSLENTLVAFHKSHLLKLRVAPSETAMTDVLREVLIMKMLNHPNIVNLIEVIDDPSTDHFYMVLEFVEGKWVCEGSGPPGGIGENTARKYLRDIVSGLIYLHAHCVAINTIWIFIAFLLFKQQNIVHGDIKPDNLLVTRTGTVKIADFSVSQVFEVMELL